MNSNLDNFNTNPQMNNNQIPTNENGVSHNAYARFDPTLPSPTIPIFIDLKPHFDYPFDSHSNLMPHT